MRRFNPTYPKYSNDLPQCNTDTFSEDTECTYTQTLPTFFSGTHAFKHVAFKSCSSSENGGSISCTGFETKLFITECSFTSCVSSSGYGGAIYAYGLSSTSVSQTLFFDCNSTNKNGGGVYLESSYCLPLLSYTLFISCHARMDRDSLSSTDDGGGFVISSSLESTELYYVVQSCRFLSCGCYEWGGGGAFGISSAVLGCLNSLFSACSCLRAEAIGISLGTADADLLIHFCFFSCTAGTTPPTDVSINRYSGSHSVPFLHSFSTKPITHSVSVTINWGTYTNQHWLPRGIKKYAKYLILIVSLYFTNRVLLFITHTIHLLTLLSVSFLLNRSIFNSLLICLCHLYLIAYISCSSTILNSYLFTSVTTF